MLLPRDERLDIRIQVAKETYFIGKRDLLQRQKRPTIIGTPEVYAEDERLDLRIQEN
jgi:hypothetical protein